MRYNVAVMRYGFLFLLSFLTLPLLAEEACEEGEYCIDYTSPPTRSDSIPLVEEMDDEYLAGYLQALIDMHYYEFQVQVVVCDCNVYLYHLPKNELLARSILAFICDVPYVQSVHRVDEDEDDEPYCEGVEEPPACEFTSPYAEVRGIWFPQSTVLFAPLIADPRQVTYSAAWRINDHPIGQNVGAVTFGDDFPIFRWKDVLRWHGDMQIGIEAGVFAVFDLDHMEKSYVNADFFVSIPLTYAFDLWSFRFRIWHLSSHVGDEFLMAHHNFDRKNLSNNAVDFFASYQFDESLRIYCGVGDVFSSDDEFPVKPFYIEYGTEIRLGGLRSYYHKLYIQPFYAMNLLNWQENDWELDATYQLGIELSKLQGVGRKVRFFFEYHDGFCDEGQFINVRSTYYALRLSYGF